MPGYAWGRAVISTITYNRGSTFTLRRSTLDVCLGGQRSFGSREAKGTAGDAGLLSPPVTPLTAVSLTKVL